MASTHRAARAPLAAPEAIDSSVSLDVQELVLVGPEGHHVDLFGEFEDPRNGEASGDHFLDDDWREERRAEDAGDHRAGHRHRLRDFVL